MPSGKKIIKSILILTENHSDADVVALFDAGGDNYISKPCTSEILLARMRTRSRRSVALSAGGTPKHSSFTLTWGNLCLDMDSGRVTFGEQVISLTATEYNLLELLRRNPDRIFSLRALLDRLRGMDGFAVYEILQSDRPIDPHHSADSESLAAIVLNLPRWR